MAALAVPPTAPPLATRRPVSSPVVPLRTSAPPLSGQRKSISNSPLPDTIPDSPIAAPPPAIEDSPSQIVGRLDPSIWLDDDDSSSMEMQIPIASNPMTVVWPVLVFALAPLALVGVVLLLWWIARTMGAG